VVDYGIDFPSPIDLGEVAAREYVVVIDLARLDRLVRERRSGVEIARLLGQRERDR
jgi:hypothetical protein